MLRFRRPPFPRGCGNATHTALEFHLAALMP